MKILFLTYYFEPDLCAGSFRNTSLFKEVTKMIQSDDKIDVITTQPNRYDSYQVTAKKVENIGENINIYRIKIPNHKSGFLGQIKSFKAFYFEAIKIAKQGNYDLVYASSSRLFTAFLGARIAQKNNAKLYLDIRDIFRESIMDIFKNSFVKFGLNLFLKPIENYTFRRANHINLVSKGFESYFKKFDKSTFSFFTNGIDDVFLNQSLEHNVENKEKQTILYAGNIGEGQGLDIVLPLAAKALESNYNFIVIGDGGAKQKLIEEIRINEITNIEIYNPMNRDLLIKEYHKADFLFLHLNKHKAFERVLPSKLFEYGTFSKPIIAGVGGYAAEFIKENMLNTILFNPGNHHELVKKLNQYDYTEIKREDFINKFSRKEINEKMAKSLFSLLR
ncbi:MAG: glycosyltransferase family 4 protein [Lutibacter sp.]|nr:MAG: glycosyltransferase WbuB [Lutibacter sp. BRH_c52]